MKPTDIKVIPGQRVRFEKGIGTVTGEIVGVRTAVVLQDSGKCAGKLVVRAAKLLKPV
jgi:hypothetical protein